MLKKVLIVWMLASCAGLAQPRVVNLGARFDRYLESAAGQPLETQLRLWSDLVETPELRFYEDFVWNKPDDPTWNERRQRLLRQMLPRLPELAPRMRDLFRDFPALLERQIPRFQQAFPDAHFDLPVYVVPGIRFDGKAGSIPGRGQVLAFGVDRIAEAGNNFEVLFSHELFHIYHGGLLGTSELPNTGFLWMEGLATFVSGQLVPTASRAEVLASRELAEVQPADVGWLASEFLAQTESGTFDFAAWFAAGKDGKLRSDLPSRCGYLLGYEVAVRLARSHSLQELASWSPAIAHAQVRNALAGLATASPTEPAPVR